MLVPSVLPGRRALEQPPVAQQPEQQVLRAGRAVAVAAPLPGQRAVVPPAAAARRRRVVAEPVVRSVRQPPALPDVQQPAPA